MFSPPQQEKLLNKSAVFTSDTSSSQKHDLRVAAPPAGVTWCHPCVSEPLSLPGLRSRPGGLVSGSEHLRRPQVSQTHLPSLPLKLSNYLASCQHNKPSLRGLTLTRKQLLMILLSRLVLFRGVIHFTHDSYGIEPLDSAPEQHLVYRLQDVTSQPRGCGTPHHENDNATEHAQYEGEDVHHRPHSRVCLHADSSK